MTESEVKEESVDNKDDLEDRAEVKTYFILSMLVNNDWLNVFNPASEEITKAYRWLDTEYRYPGMAAFWSSVCLLASFLIVDLLVDLNGQMYGLAMALLGSILLVYPNLRGPDVIASVAEDERRAIRKLESENMVYNNTGFAILSVGFVLQMWAVQTGWNGLSTNLIADVVPGWVTGLLLISSFLISSFVFRYKSRFPEGYPNW